MDRVKGLYSPSLSIKIVHELLYNSLKIYFFSNKQILHEKIKQHSLFDNVTMVNIFYGQTMVK